MDAAWNLIQSKVCRKCMDGDGKGHCRLPAGETCALKESLPAILRTVESVGWAPYEEYVRALRVNVCAQCKDQDAYGVCVKRNSLECALDRYYGLVIRVIDEIHAGTFAEVR